MPSPTRTSAAASAPNDNSGEYVKLAIASKGISQMSAIGERVRGIGKEYDDIGGDKKNALGGDNLDRWKQNPPPVTPDDNRTQDDKIAEWYVKWNDLNQEIEDLRRTRPPDGLPPGNPRVEAWNERRRELWKKQAELAQEAAELGLEISGAPPPTVHNAVPEATANRSGSNGVPPTVFTERDTNPTRLRRP